MGKLGWFMSKTRTATSPPSEGEPAGTRKEDYRELVGWLVGVLSQSTTNSYRERSILSSCVVSSLSPFLIITSRGHWFLELVVVPLCSILAFPSITDGGRQIIHVHFKANMLIPDYE